jgi:hypothetical protein
MSHFTFKQLPGDPGSVERGMVVRLCGQSPVRNLIHIFSVQGRMLNSVLALVLMLSTIGYTVGSAYCSMAPAMEERTTCCCETSCEDKAPAPEEGMCCETASHYIALKSDVVPSTKISLPVVPVLEFMTAVEPVMAITAVQPPQLSPHAFTLALSARDNCARTSNFRI